MAFKDFCSNGKCDVCGKETKIVVCSGGYGPMSNAYCEECLNDGLQPYNVMVAYISCAGRFPDDVNEVYVKDVRRILAKLNISEEQFIRDVDYNINQLNDALSSDEIGFHCGEIDCEYHAEQHCMRDKCKYQK